MIYIYVNICFSLSHVKKSCCSYTQQNPYSLFDENYCMFFFMPRLFSYVHTQKMSMHTSHARASDKHSVKQKSCKLTIKQVLSSLNMQDFFYESRCASIALYCKSSFHVECSNVLSYMTTIRLLAVKRKWKH